MARKAGDEKHPFEPSDLRGLVKAIRIDNKEKVLTLIDSLRMNPAEAERIGLNLDIVANIVKSFENPIIEAKENPEAEYGAESEELYRKVELVSEQFDADLGRYERGELPDGFRFDLGMPSAILKSAGFPNLPIRMRKSLLEKKSAMQRHPFSANDITGLVRALQNPLAVMKYSKANMRNVIVDIEKNGEHFLVGVTLNYRVGDVEINSVSGLFPKDDIEWLKAIQRDEAIYLQKEKVQHIIDSQRTTNTVESERIGLNLDMVANIVKSFENPIIEESTR